MLARRLLVFALVFLLLTTLVSAIAPVPDDERATKADAPRVPAPAVEAAGELPADETVRAKVGDVVVLRVRAPAADVVRIDPLGLDADASPDLPARFEFVATHEGRFPVVLEQARRRVGTLVVTGGA